MDKSLFKVLACALLMVIAGGRLRLAENQEDEPGGAYEFHSLNDSGLKLLQKGEYEMALDFFLRAAPLDTTGYIAYENIGDTYVAMADPKSAIRSYEFCILALENNPGMGTTSVRKRVFEKVLNMVRKDPSLLGAVRNKMTVSYLETAVQRYEDKRKDEEQRLKKADDATRRRIEHGELIKQGKVDGDTVKLTDVSDKFNVSGALSILAKGDAYLRRSRFEESLAIYAQLIEMFPDHIEFWERQGDALRLMGRKEEATEAYETAIALAKALRTRLEDKLDLVKEK
ncbi:MAG: tetratricopeptide repeat protein [Planctomycetota bacterium]|nr:tetratricopeptide repeat protein [Planctomycetota bacterium]